MFTHGRTSGKIREKRAFVVYTKRLPQYIESIWAIWLRFPCFSLWFWGRRRRDRTSPPTNDAEASPQRRANVTGTPRPGRPPAAGTLLQGRSAWKQSVRTASTSPASTATSSPAAQSTASTSGVASPNLFTTRVRPA